MVKYVITPKISKASHAGFKAKEDMDYFLQQQGYESIRVSITQNKIYKTIESLRIPFYLNHIQKGDQVIIQYPQYSYVLMKKIINQLHKKGAYCVGLIHDIEGLRQQNNERLHQDFEIFEMFDELIVHTEAMKKWLESKGFYKNSKVLEIFDYKVDIENNNSINDISNQSPIVFAGNLNKSIFLKTLTSIDLDVFGPCTFIDELPVNIHYKGEEKPENLPILLSNYQYGLVWDGDSEEVISGAMGEYLKYNAPHKASLYLSAGLPIIVWKSSAISTWVEKNNLGISIRTLDEIPIKLKSVNYEIFKENVEEIRKHIINGYYIKKAVEAMDDEAC